LTIVLSGTTPETKDEYLRVHIRADSNLPEAQAVKYAVRDEIVNYLTPIVAACESKKALQNALKSHISDMEAVADETLKKHGFTYRSTAEASIYPYVRPQETGHHTGARWLDLDGLMTVVGNDFEFNVLGCSTEDLDEGDAKHNRHINDVPVRDYVEVCIDYTMTGVGGYNSWGSRTEPTRSLWSNKDYKFSFAIVPDASPARKNAEKYEY